MFVLSAVLRTDSHVAVSLYALHLSSTASAGQLTQQRASRNAVQGKGMFMV